MLSIFSALSSLTVVFHYSFAYSKLTLVPITEVEKKVLRYKDSIVGSNPQQVGLSGLLLLLGCCLDSPGSG